MEGVKKDEKGYIQNTRDIETQMPNGYVLKLCPGRMIGEDFEETEYWADERDILLAHAAFSSYIKDFALPRKYDVIIDAEGEYMDVHRVFVCYSEKKPFVEIEFT